jgi:glutamate-5-semialdehyde dehydrogenase
MKTLLPTEKINLVLNRLVVLLDQERNAIIKINQHDFSNFSTDDHSNKKNLLIDDSRINEMILTLNNLVSQKNNQIELLNLNPVDGIGTIDDKATLGTTLKIYETNPNIIIEAGGIAFKSGNKIILEGGKDTILSNTKIISLWHQALIENNIPISWIEYLENGSENSDTISLQDEGKNKIESAKDNGNNFVYINRYADLDIAFDIITKRKTSNASESVVNKVLIDKNLQFWKIYARQLVTELQLSNVTLVGDMAISLETEIDCIENDLIWYQEFLEDKIIIGTTNSDQEAITKINKCCSTSASIITKNSIIANFFLTNIDSQVYHNVDCNTIEFPMKQYTKY